MNDSRPPSPQSSSDPAKARFLVIQLVRTGSAVMILFGLLVTAGRTDLPALAGYAITLGGMFGTFVAPLLLARRWKSRQP